MFAGPLGRSTFTPPKSSFDSPLYGLVSLRRSHLAGPALGPLPESVTWAELWGLVALGFVGLAAILFTL